MNLPKTSEYDGFYFIPTDDDEDYSVAFFHYTDELKKEIGKEVPPSDVGKVYHIALFKRDKDDTIRFDDKFDAIFADPITYIKGLTGSGLFGCVMTKTENSHIEFNRYVEDIAEENKIRI